MTATAEPPRTRLARRAFVAVWVLLGLVGALDHTVAEEVFGRRFDLLLPHLKYGDVMFNKNPRHVTVFEYSAADGVRRPLADLARTPAPGYAEARLAINAVTEPMYVPEVCYRATHRAGGAAPGSPSGDEYTFYVDEYDVDANARRPARSSTLTCNAHGLTPR